MARDMAGKQCACLQHVGHALLQNAGQDLLHVFIAAFIRLMYRCEQTLNLGEMMQVQGWQPPATLP